MCYVKLVSTSYQSRKIALISSASMEEDAMVQRKSPQSDEDDADVCGMGMASGGCCGKGGMCGTWQRTLISAQIILSTVGWMLIISVIIYFYAALAAHTQSVVQNADTLSGTVLNRTQAYLAVSDALILPAGDSPPDQLTFAQGLAKFLDTLIPDLGVTIGAKLTDLAAENNVTLKFTQGAIAINDFITYLSDLAATSKQSGLSFTMRVGGNTGGGGSATPTGVGVLSTPTSMQSTISLSMASAASTTPPDASNHATTTTQPPKS